MEDFDEPKIIVEVDSSDIEWFRGLEWFSKNFADITEGDDTETSDSENEIYESEPLRIPTRNYGFSLLQAIVMKLREVKGISELEPYKLTLPERAAFETLLLEITKACKEKLDVINNESPPKNKYDRLANFMDSVRAVGDFEAQRDRYFTILSGNPYSSVRLIPSDFSVAVKRHPLE